MRSSPQVPDHSQCPICRAEVPPASPFCGACGSKVTQTPAQEILNLNYLLAELTRWEAAGIVKPEQSQTLREAYELKREELRAQLRVNGRQEKHSASRQEAKLPAQEERMPWATPPQTGSQESQFASVPPSVYREPVAPLRKHSQPRAQETEPQRTLLEKLSDPHTIRILLYTGAGMLVVGVIIWLRDILYLKLQEPIVQASLLAIGTILVMVCGWLITLRTRLLMTGRALTLTGSLLVPINFWFLVRSGLIENNGRAWVVCALCSLLYAHTAALLREKLYVYLASVTGIVTVWMLVYRFEREAMGLYALSLMVTSLIFLHLSQLFSRTRSDESQAGDNPQSQLIARTSYELWGPPLVSVSLVGATLAALLYMPWRFGSPPSFAQGVFRLRASEYDASIAMLLFACLAYAVWFAGRYVYTNRRVLLYSTSALALFWTEFLAVDGLQLSGSRQVLILAATAFVVAIAVRLSEGATLPVVLHRASLIVSIATAAVVYAIASSAPSLTITHGAILISIAATFAVASAPESSEGIAAPMLAYASAIFASGAFLVVLLSLKLESETLSFAACAAWPFVLYMIAAISLAARRETQIAAPFMHIADAESVLLLLSACALTFALDQGLQSETKTFEHLPGTIFSLLTGAVIYGWLRGWREHSAVGVALMSVALLVLVVATGDALKDWGALPAAWPVASTVIIAAFLMRAAAHKLLRAESVRTTDGGSQFSKVTGLISRASLIGIVADGGTVASASLWFANALLHFNEGGTSAAIVLSLALLYWGARAARMRQPWLVYVFVAHMGALLIALLIALRVEAQWFACAAVLILFPVFFVTAKRALAHGIEWIARPASAASGSVLAITAVASLLQALLHLQVSERALLAPSVTLGAGALLSFAASFWSEEPERIRYFRTGLSAIIFSFVFLCLRAGFDPISDVEIYTAPVAVLLLVVAYVSARRGWTGYESDTDFLLWAGSLLLSGPLLLHALNFRFTDVPAPWRDLATLCASLALLLLGVTGRLRASLVTGALSLALELVALTMTSVDWLQIPLKVYLISVGALILLVWGGLEFRREQILRLRQRLNERREYARERFGAWR